MEHLDMGSQILLGWMVLTGKRGLDWNFLIDVPLYWDMWARLNRN